MRLQTLDEVLHGKTIDEVSYKKYEYVVIRFTDGSVVYINQMSQTGVLQVDYNHSFEVADDEAVAESVTNVTGE